MARTWCDLSLNPIILIMECLLFARTLNFLTNQTQLCFFFFFPALLFIIQLIDTFSYVRELRADHNFSFRTMHQKWERGLCRIWLKSHCLSFSLRLFSQSLFICAYYCFSVIYYFIGTIEPVVSYSFTGQFTKYEFWQGENIFLPCLLVSTIGCRFKPPWILPNVLVFNMWK